MCTYSEQHKESLILLPHTVINPGTVVIHLLDTSFTNTANKETKTVTNQFVEEEAAKGKKKKPECMMASTLADATFSCALTCSGVPSQA